MHNLTPLQLAATWAAVVWLSLVAPVAAAQALDSEALEALLERIRIERKMPGLRAAVRFDDGRIVTAAVGLADKQTGQPLDDHIGMPGGSTGKTFTATLAMLLVEDGKLSLDDPVANYLGEHRWFTRLPNSETMRVRHLLSHSAGIGDYPQSIRFNMAMVVRVLRHGSAYFEPEELIGFASGRKPRFPAGEGYFYSDAGYLLLGRVIEAASGRGYYELLHERILHPQALTRIRPQDQSVLRDVATGYMAGSKNTRKDGRMKFDPRSEWTGGGLITNPTMLVRFYAALAAGEIISKNGFKSMVESGWKDPQRPGEHYGFGIFVAQHGRVIGHGGLWPGYRSHVTHILDSNLTIAVQTNRDGRVDLLGLVGEIAAVARGKDDNE